jgi:hypothetical protein
MIDITTIVGARKEVTRDTYESTIYFVKCLDELIFKGLHHYFYMYKDASDDADVNVWGQLGSAGRADIFLRRAVKSVCNKFHMRNWE